MGTRLSLCQDLRLLAGIPGNGPLTTLNQTGEYGLIVKWIGDAWREIQARHLWDWMWEEATVTILSGTSRTAGTIPAYSPYSGGMPATVARATPWGSTTTAPGCTASSRVTVDPSRPASVKRST